MIIWAVTAIVVATLYGLQIGTDKNHNTTKVCVAITCNMESSGTEGTSAVRIKQPPSLGP